MRHEDWEGRALRARRRWLILALTAILSIGAAPAAARPLAGSAVAGQGSIDVASAAGPVAPGEDGVPAGDVAATAGGAPGAPPDAQLDQHDDHLAASRAHFREPTAAELAALGFVPGTGPCAGTFNAFPPAAPGHPARRPAADDGTACTHGPDYLESNPATVPPADSGSTVYGNPLNPSYAPPESIPCYATGPYVHVFYGYLAGGTNRLAALRTKILQAVSIADDIYARSAAQAGRIRHVRWKMSSCQLVIDAVPLSASVLNQAYPGPIRSALESAGKMTTSEKGLIFTDEAGCFGGVAGIAEIESDTTAASTNRNNKGNLLARVMACAWTTTTDLPATGEIAAHEVTHTMGAVQNDAPNASYRTGGSFHCTDGDDVMCYDDGGGPPRAICAAAYPQYLDCRKDDYFSPVPAAGSYIATHWNTANNQFLATAAPTSVMALAHPTATLTAPATGQTSGIVNLAATASAAGDGTSVIQVEFWANGNVVGADTTAPYTAQFDTRFDGQPSPFGYPNGTQLKVVALAVDTAGRIVPSAIRTLDIENPTVHFTSPTPAPYAGVTTPTVAWAAAATSGSALPVSKVEVLNGGSVIATDTGAPYSGTIPLDVGANHLTVRVTDSRGTTRDSGVRIVTRADATPTATMLWPSTSLNPSVVAGVTQTLWATGTVATGRTVSTAQFLIDGTPLGGVPTKVGSNWKLNWVPLTGGVFNSVTFRLTDSASTVVTSDPTGFQVLDAPAASHPTISLTSPASGATVNGSTTITANVAVPAGFTASQVDFFVNGTWVDTEPGATGSVSYGWTNTGISGLAFFSAQVSADDGSTFDTVDSLPVMATVTAPTTFTITSPANGAALKGDVNVTASISHPEFLQSDPELWLGGDFYDFLYGPPYATTLSTLQFENGTTSLQLRASLTDGSPITSPKVTVTFANAAISQTIPTAGATVTSKINLAATATGTYDVGIEQVRFKVDGAIVGRDSYAPYAVAWDPAPVATGSHTTAVEMLMTDGNLLSSPTRSFTVARTPTVTRLAGPDRYSTAATISRNSFAAGVPAVYIATGLSFPDALAGAAVAGHVGAPLLLVPGTSIPAVVATELTRLKPAKIVVLGGTGVVSDGVKTALVKYTSGSVTRLAGPDRYSTAATISRNSFAAGVPAVYIATGLSFPDALAGAAVAGHVGAPLLLVPGTSIPAVVATELTRLKPAKIVVLGGTGVVSDGVKTALVKYL